MEREGKTKKEKSQEAGKEEDDVVKKSEIGNRAGIFVVTAPVRSFARSVVVATQSQMRVARSFSL